MDFVRIGLIGFGNIGTHHARYFNEGKIKGAGITAICDINPARLELARERYGESIKYFDSYEAMASSGLIDMVIIAAPHYFHPIYGMDAMRRGLHVISEKPIGVYTKNVAEMDAVAKETGLTYAVMFNERTEGWKKKVREIIASGELGRLKRMTWIITNWYRTQAYYNSGGWRATWAQEGGGILINQCPHTLDLWQWFFGMPKRLRGFCYEGKNRDIEVEDDVTAFMEYEGGATGVLTATTGEAPGTNRLEVAGDNGKLVFENNTIKLWKLEMSESEYNRTAKTGFDRPKSESFEVEYEKCDSGHHIITQNAVNNVLFGEPLYTPATEGIKSLTLSNAMYLSSWTDDWVDIPIDADLYLRELEKRIAISKVKPFAGSAAVADMSSSFNG